ncbi:neprilysin-2-like [Cotesia typhae]|uniref:neprilysin-2-like n=1 Tax=Cotesia typhae TaxID=2053667 RepID=UPI003D68128F
MKPNLFPKTASVLMLTVIGFVFLSNSSAAVVDITQNDEVASHKCTGNTCSVEQSEIAARVTRYRDVNINPCENFFGFACGGYKKTDKADDDYTQLEVLRNENIKKLIQKGTSSEAKPYKLIDDIYKTCVNKNAKGQQALELMKKIIKSLGSWPLLEDDKWKEDDFNWIDFTSNAKKVGYNINYFLDWESSTIYKDKKKVIRYSVTMARTHFNGTKSNEIVKQKSIYTEFMVKIAKLMGASDNASQELSDAFDFEAKLQEINGRNVSDYTPQVTLGNFEKQIPGIEWSKFIEKTLKPFVDPDEKPIMTARNLTALMEFVKLIEKTPKRVQANYAIWKLIQYTLPFLPNEYQEEQKAFQKQVAYTEAPIEDVCIQAVKKYAKYAVNSLYLDQYKSSQETIKTMVAAVKEDMIKMVKDSKTLTEEEKNGAIEVVKKMVYSIGPSEKLMDPKELEKFYADAQVVEDNFLQTILNLNLFKLKKELSNKVQSEVFPFFIIKSIHPGIPENFNGYLYIPISMVSSTYFNANRPMYMNLGTSGSYIATNIFKSISFFGRKSTEAGELATNDRVDCFRNEFVNLTDASKPNLRNRTVEDMISYFMGLRTARATYQNYVAKNGAEQPLTGLTHTPEQLFWMSFFQGLCPVYSRLSEADLNKVNREALMVKLLANIPEVAADFKCPVGSNLNPEKRCTWW